jgi:hypothetical protein
MALAGGEPFAVALWSLAFRRRRRRDRDPRGDAIQGNVERLRLVDRRAPRARSGVLAMIVSGGWPSFGAELKRLASGLGK